MYTKVRLRSSNNFDPFTLAVVHIYDTKKELNLKKKLCILELISTLSFIMQQY